MRGISWCAIAIIAMLCAACEPRTEVIQGNQSLDDDTTSPDDDGVTEDDDPAPSADDDTADTPTDADDDTELDETPTCTPERCDGVDNDCDGVVDNGCPPPTDDDSDADGDVESADEDTGEDVIPLADLSVAPSWKTEDLLALPDGTPVLVATVIDGYAITHLRARLVGFVSNPLTSDSRDPFLLLETDPTDARWDLVLGPVAGMSGSPIIIEGKLAGALSYGIGDTVGPFGFIATPIERMLDVDAAPAAWPLDDGPDPLAVVMSMSPAYTAWTNPADMFDPRFVTVTTDSATGMGSAADDAAPPMVPGSAIAVLMISGNVLNLGGIGTLTAVDGDAVWAFGHPMFGDGDTSIPFSNARIDAIAANPTWGAYKIGAPTGPLLGTITADRVPAVAGYFGDIAGVRTSLTGTYAGSTETVRHLVARYGNPWATAGDATFSVIWPITVQREKPFGGEGAITFTVRVSVAETDTVAERTDVISSPFWPEAEIFYDFADNIGMLIGDEHTPLTPVNVTLIAEISDEQNELRITHVTNAETVDPGDNLVLAVDLQPSGPSDIETRGFVLKVPADFPPGSALLEVASEYYLGSGYWDVWRDPACAGGETPPTPEDLVAEFNARPRRSVLVAQLTSLAMPDPCMCEGDPEACPPCDDVYDPCATPLNPPRVRTTLQEDAAITDGRWSAIVEVTGEDMLDTTKPDTDPVEE
ncbi:MAG: hypothetical protein Q7T01_02205 [bacterium]|nr:hypothetical protein [bacterium]